MHKTLIFLLLLTIYSCGTGQSVANSLQQNSNNCPEQPQTRLDTKEVKLIELKNQIITESGIASKNKSIGYTFNAQQGQKLNYKTKADICFWVYTPDNELLNSGVLPKTGTYTIQISAPKGSTTFELSMNLDSESADTNISNNTKQFTSRNTERPSAAEMISNHYITLNNRQYRETWNNLSPNFQKLSGSSNAYGDYAEWWNSVERIEIGEVRTVRQNANQAIVDAELNYIMKTGRNVNDQKNRIYLIWDNTSGKWLINQKVKP